MKRIALLIAPAALCLLGASSTWAQSIHVDGSIEADGQLVSQVLTGTPPLLVTSTSMVSNLNADKVDGLDGADFALDGHVHMLMRFKSYGSAAFAAAQPGGGSMICAFPAANCRAPNSSTVNLYLHLGIEGPSTLDEVNCQVEDSDDGTDKEITLEVYSSSVSVGSDATSGGVAGSQFLVVKPVVGIGEGSRGPTIRLTFVKGTRELQRVFQCTAKYSQTVS